MGSPLRVLLNGCSVSSQVCYMSAQAANKCHFFRLCRIEGHTSNDYSSRLQDLPHVCNNKYRSYGYLCLVSYFSNPFYISFVLTASTSFLPETKGRSLEEMDIIFGSTSKERRDADIAKQERGEFFS